MTARGVLAVGALIALALGTWLILDRDRGDSSSADAEDTGSDSEVDYYMTDATMTRYDETGRIHYELDAQRADHYRHEQETRAETVSMVYYGPDRPPWTVRAARSVVPDHARQVYLEGNVRADYRTAEEDAPTVLLTPAAIVFPEQDLMTSDAGVRIIQRQDEVTAKYMKANIATGVIYLEGDVHGVLRSRYVR